MRCLSVVPAALADRHERSIRTLVSQPSERLQQDRKAPIRRKSACSADQGGVATQA
jgi:hypothetical protein